MGLNPVEVVNTSAAPIPVALFSSVGALVDVNSAIVADVDAAVAAATGLRLMGFAAKESAGVPAAASATIVRGATGAGGTAVYPIKLALSTSMSAWFGPAGIDCATGISIDWIAGQLDCHLYYSTGV